MECLARRRDPSRRVDRDRLVRAVRRAASHIGLNYWYLARKTTYTAVPKGRGGVVEELGIADNQLTTNRGLQSVLMHSFY